MSVLSILTVLTVGADGVAVGILHQLAVQRPVPVVVFALRQAYLRRVAGVAFRAVIDGDGVGVQELDGVAHLLSAFHERSDRRDAVSRVEQLPDGGDVVVGFLLPLFEGGKAFFVVVHLLPQRGVVVVVARGKAQGGKEYQQVKLC